MFCPTWHFRGHKAIFEGEAVSFVGLAHKHELNRFKDEVFCSKMKSSDPKDNASAPKQCLFASKQCLFATKIFMFGASPGWPVQMNIVLCQTNSLLGQTSSFLPQR